MERRYLGLVVVILIIIASAVVWFLMFSEQPESRQIPANGLTLSSTAYENNGTIPEKYTFDGQDVSPPLQISGVKGDSIALIMDDPDADGFVHWLIWNIPKDTETIPEGVPQNETVQTLNGARQGMNDFGEIGYRGPKPPEGEKHEYRIRIYVLDKNLDLDSGASEDELQEAMNGHIVQMTELVGTYQR